MDSHTWWSEFLAEPRVRGAKDGYDAVEELKRYIAALSRDLQSEFVSELAEIACAQSEGWGLALGALEKTHDTQALARIARHVRHLKATTGVDDQSAFEAFLRVLAHSTDADHRDLIEDYLLAGPIGLNWYSVPWALWPGDQDLFGRAWARYFTTIPDETWRNTLIVQAFLSRPDALVCVRDALRATDRTAWNVLRAAVMEHSDAPWLNGDERRRVRLACDAG